MKHILGAAALALATATFSTSAGAVAVATITITVDENGHGTITDGATTIPLTGALLANGTGGPSSALTYALAALGLTPLSGDVVLLEDPDHVSDVIRFNLPVGTTFIPPQLLFFSDNDGSDDGALADTGLPTTFSTNVTRILEVGAEGSNGAFYTPTANQPGFIPGFVTTYHFISDSSVPEPSTWAMMLAGFGAIGLAFRRRRRKTLALG